MRAFIHSLPKAELHAHLHGSVSTETLRELGCTGFVEQGRSLGKCFKLFELIHNTVQDTKTLETVVYNVVKDFARDNVLYLELRSTPRATPFMTKRQYLETLTETARNAERLNEVTVRLLLTIDRARSVEDAWDSLEAYTNLPPRLRKAIVGVDFSGDPRKGRFKDFLPVLQAARAKHSLKIALHCGELSNTEEEIAEMLRFKPERLGHALHVPQNRKPTGMGTTTIGGKSTVSTQPVCECCPTSNIMKTLGLRSIKEHPLLPPAHWNDLVICTDDAGVFETSLTDEYLLLAENFEIGYEELVDMVVSTLDHAFACEDDLTLLKEAFNDKIRAL